MNRLLNLAHNSSHLSRYQCSSLIQNTSILDQTVSRPYLLALESNSRIWLRSLSSLWANSQIAVPLGWMQSMDEWNYIRENVGSKSVLVSPAMWPKVSKWFLQLPVDIREQMKILLISDDTGGIRVLQDGRTGNQGSSGFQSSDALVIFTSGTTGKPKGVVHTHESLYSQMESLQKCWDLNAQDHILNCLPLHHVHGLVNGLLSVAHAGGTIEFLKSSEILPKYTPDVQASAASFSTIAAKYSLFLPGQFDPGRVWKRFIPATEEKPPITLFTGVPTQYTRLIHSYHHQLEHQDQLKISRWLRKSPEEGGCRLFMSGSSALPMKISQDWESLPFYHDPDAPLDTQETCKSRIRLLERYGMTEIGMGLSNPLNGERKPGTVGFPMPGVETALIPFREAGTDQSSVHSNQFITAPNTPGELVVRSTNLFCRYFNREEATEETFIKDEQHRKWFLTGDVVAVDDDGYYRIQGRKSVDIIKVHGYKVSALEIEFTLLHHPSIAECAVCAVLDARDASERVAAVITLKPTKDGTDLKSIREWCKQHMSPYKVPTLWHVVNELPRNAMGKVDKRGLVRQYFANKV